MKISDHFDSLEFAQHDGTRYPDEWLNDPTRLVKLVAALEKLRAVWNQPIEIISAYRSVAYNKAIYEARGQKPTTSQHSEGRAADIRIRGVIPSIVRDQVKKMYRSGDLDVGGLGWYDKAHGDFCHVDVRLPDPKNVRLAYWENFGS